MDYTHLIQRRVEGKLNLGIWLAVHHSITFLLLPT